MKVVPIAFAFGCTVLGPAFFAQAAPEGKPKTATAKPKKQPPPAMTMEATERELSPFEIAMQENSEHFASLTPNYVVGGINFDSTVTLNEKPLIFKGERYDGFTFRTPKDNVGDLNWGYSRLPNATGWYILPVEGTMEGFKNYSYDDKNVYQQLSADHLKPDTSYIIWFAFEDDKPATAQVSLNLLPKMDVSKLIGKTKTEVEALLGKPREISLLPGGNPAAINPTSYKKIEVYGFGSFTVFYKQNDAVVREISASFFRRKSWKEALDFISLPAEGTQAELRNQEQADSKDEDWLLTQITGLPKEWKILTSPSAILLFDANVKDWSIKEPENNGE